MKQNEVWYTSVLHSSLLSVIDINKRIETYLYFKYFCICTIYINSYILVYDNLYNLQLCSTNKHINQCW